ncbi:MAG: hypothetical protein ABIH52_04135 [Candidatus Aenigmatarchaeota archaeon]|nr:hypothetical protein [Nanoarchaeota archaeon]
MPRTILRPEEVPFMNWGMVTETNYDGRWEEIPIKRYDPLFSHPIRLNGNPIDKMTGRFSYTSPVRATRPSGSSDDVFGPIVRGEEKDESYVIVVVGDGKNLNSAFSLEPIIGSYETYSAISFLNRYPAMLRHIDTQVEKDVISRLDAHSKIARGMNFVTTTTNRYDNISDMPQKELEELLKSMSHSISHAVAEVNERGIQYIPIYPFFNLGPKVGGTVKQVHAQTYLDLNNDGHGSTAEFMLTAFTDGCRVCESEHDGRLIYQNKGFDVWVSASPRRDHHIRFAPREHVRKLTDFDGFEDYAEVILASNRALDQLGVEEDRNIEIYTCPDGYDSKFHWFGEILPWQRVGGFERLDNTQVVRKSPNEAANELKKAIANL